MVTSLYFLKFIYLFMFIFVFLDFLKFYNVFKRSL